jgi:radical SAM superfamily enzyme YgiQ (UPF0313 family)
MGAHGTLKPEEILEYTNAEAVIRGEPEQTVLEICKNRDLSKIKGVTFKVEGKIISNDDREPLNLDQLPIPSYHLLPLDKYFYEVLGDRFMLFEASRGCPYQCNYCQKEMFKGYRRKSSKNLINEVKTAIQNHGVKTAYFIDLEFTVNRKLVLDLCDFLIANDYDFKWCCQTRLDSIDLTLLKRMKDAGCSLIHYGVESGSERIMKLINKKITLQKIEEGLKLTQKAKIKSACFFMIGLPSETKEDMKKTIDFANHLNPTYASFHIWTPYPGTYFYDLVKEDLTGLFPEAYTKELTLNELQKMVNKALIKFYLRPNYAISRLVQGDVISLVKQLRLFLGYIKS